MSKSRNNDNQCNGKMRHPTRRHAQDHKAALGYQGMSVYQCAYCGDWHVGHNKPRRLTTSRPFSFRRWLQEGR